MTRFASFLLLLLVARPVAAQTTGSLLGRVVDAESGDPIAGVSVQVVNAARRTVSGGDGRFLLVGLALGEHALRIEVLGYRPQQLERVPVRAARPTEVQIELTRAAIALPGVSVEAERVRLVEPEVSSTRAVVLARELAELPIDRIEQAVELTPGVSNGHFRGGRVGQAAVVVDGFEVKNQLEGSSQGQGLELAPSALQEVEVVTGGFGAQYGSALSGVVSYVTRRGAADRWRGRAAVSTDRWAPASLDYGFSSLSASAGGPVPWLGGGTTVFADVLLQGLLDADPRVRGLTCVRPGDAGNTLRTAIDELRALAPQLYCPLTSVTLPHQRGDRLIAFGRLDRPLAPGLALTLSLLRNRYQRELYTPEWRYAEAQLGQRVTGTMGAATLHWTLQNSERAWQVTLRGALLRLDRHLGAVDPWTFTTRASIAGFGMRDFRFLGEDYVRAPIERQLRDARAVPGYGAPGGADTPFGVAGEGIFFTAGTPHLANWSRSDQASVDLAAELLTRTGSSVRGGGSLKLYGVESYERALSHLAGSVPGYARFYPRTASAFADAHLGVADEINIDLGLRLDAFRSGISFRADRRDFLSPVLDPDWQLSVNPRLGVSLPLAAGSDAAVLRFNFGYVSQPPDFRYFLDSTIGDSLRSDIRRQGNPNLSFERGKSYELSLGKLLRPGVGATLTVFRKELSNVVTGALRLGETGDQQYTTDDQGRVTGAELAVRARRGDVVFRGSYALQKATGLSSGLDSDSLAAGDGRSIEYPLAFDRRHSLDAALLYGRASGEADSPWAAALTVTAASGYPHDIRAAAGEVATGASAWLPWNTLVNLRVARELGRVPLCGDCTWRVSADGRNLLGTENVLAYRGDTGSAAPALAAVQALASTRSPGDTPIPAGSPAYTPATDLDADGLITPDEYRTARFAAALERHDPTLFFGEPRQLRLGLEVTFQ